MEDLATVGDGAQLVFKTGLSFSRPSINQIIMASPATTHCRTAVD
jgi:hypothetical protein